jgi:hypothetical protein
MHTVVETPDYLRDAKDAHLTEDDCGAIVRHLAAHPDAGELIQGTGGARKLRFAGRGRGKSGGYRIITFYAGEDVPVFLLNVFAKGDKVNLSKAERNELRSVLATLATTYRKGVSAHVKGRRSHS